MENGVINRPMIGPSGPFQPHMRSSPHRFILPPESAAKHTVTLCNGISEAGRSSTSVNCLMLRESLQRVSEKPLRARVFRIENHLDAEWQIQYKFNVDGEWGKSVRSVLPCVREN